MGKYGTMIEVPEILIKQKMLSHWLAERATLAEGTHPFNPTKALYTMKIAEGRGERRRCKGFGTMGGSGYRKCNVNVNWQYW